MTATELHALLVEKLPATSLADMDYFSVSHDWKPVLPKSQDAPQIDEFRWIVVDVVAGNSEGHYIHVAKVSRLPLDSYRYDILITGKTFLGMDAALAVAAELTRIIDAGLWDWNWEESVLLTDLLKGQAPGQCQVPAQPEVSSLSRDLDQSFQDNRLSPRNSRLETDSEG